MKSTIEWTAPNATPEVAAELVEIQRGVHSWLLDWAQIEVNLELQRGAAAQAGLWADSVLKMSGLGESGPTSVSRRECIPKQHKFAVIALPNVWHRVEEVTHGNITVGRVPPVAIDETWKHWLGSLQSDRFAEADFYVWAAVPSPSPSILDSENNALTLRCERFVTALAIAMPHFTCDRAIEATGARDLHGIRVRQVGSINPFLGGPNVPRMQLTEGDVQGAHELVGVVEELARFPNSALAKSTKSFLEGMQTSNPARRLHAFVRCVEGVIRPSIGTTRVDFIERVQSIMKGDARATLEQIYDIRSADEHLKDVLETLPGTNDVKLRLLDARVVQSETIARHFLKTVFASNRLRGLLQSKSSAEVFWESRDTALWGMPLDLEAEAGTQVL